MAATVTISPGPPGSRSGALTRTRSRPPQRRTTIVVLGMGLAFAVVGGQLVRLALSGGEDMVASVSEPLAQSFSRPDIVDHDGRLLATDVEMPSLFADPSRVQNRDEIAEKLYAVLPGFDEAELRRTLEDRTRRFAWIRRGLSPKLAQAVHDLGLPGLAFRDELRRAYPLGRLAGHVIGHVNVDNRGVAGIERHIDDTVGVEAVHAATLSAEAAVRLSLDIGVEHSLEDELASAMRRYEAQGAAGLVMDVTTGEMLAAASLPGVDPSRPGESLERDRIDKIAGGAYELGSVWKIVTLAMALDGGTTSLDAMIDVTQPLTAGRFTITDTHPSSRPLSTAEVFIHSSNIGAALLALDVGADRQQDFLKKLGLLAPMKTELGPVAAPIAPERFGRTEQITVAYGHGLAVAPIQFAAAAAALINGGKRVEPTFLRRFPDTAAERPRVIATETSAKINDLLRRNVTDPHGTGKRADVLGYRVGGKTGTAEIPGRGGYREKAVISSFLAAFPMDAPKYLVLVSLFEPKGNQETAGEILAGMNAAPTAARVIERIAPLLGVLPVGPVASVAQ
jgi:cell division protein FtsI (penicillin-binding protein 3)